MNKEKNAELNITTKIWEKELYQLVDYYNQEFNKTKLNINSSGLLYRDENNVYFTENENPEKKIDKLLKIKKNELNGQFSVDCGNWPKDLNHLVDEIAAFIVYRGISLKDNVNTYSHRYYKLNPGDIIKIGRIYFKVLEIHISQQKDRLGFGINVNGDESTFKGVNCNSIIINGQEVIKGIFKKKGDIVNDKKLLEPFLSGDAKPRKNSIFNLEKSSNNNNKFLENLDKYNNDNDNDQNLNSDLFSITKRTKKKQKSKNKKNLSNMNTISLNKEAKKKINNFNPNQNIKATKQCRICYGDDSTEDNPLIYPCICKNTTKYIHYECLKKWLKSKIEEDMSMDSENGEIEVISYNRKDISCEICKENLPDFIKYKKRIYNISFYEPKYKEYIVLESMRADKHKAKFIHLISFDNKNNVHIGRANECELSIAELSVSRFHCILHKKDGEIYLEDNTSKFGTLVLVQNNNLIINNNIPLYLQINKTFIKIKIPRTEGCSFLCYKDAPVVEQSLLNYQVQNSKGLETSSIFIIKNNDDNEKEEENEENNNDSNINKNKELIDEENKEQTDDENVVLSTEKDLIDKDKSEEMINNNNNNQSAISENKLTNKSAHLTKIKKVLIKNDSMENNDDINKNNLSFVVNKKNNFSNNNNSGQHKIINLIKIKKQTLDKAYDKTKFDPVTTNNQNVYKSKSININKEEINKDE